LNYRINKKDKMRMPMNRKVEMTKNNNKIIMKITKKNKKRYINNKIKNNSKAEKELVWQIKKR
jgi:hypothetical protein